MTMKFLNRCADASQDRHGTRDVQVTLFNGETHTGVLAKHGVLLVLRDDRVEQMYLNPDLVISATILPLHPAR